MTEPIKPIVWPEVDCSQEESPRFPNLYASIQQMREDRWRQTVLAYEANPDFYNSWWWLNLHPIFYYFGQQNHESALVADQGVIEGLEFRPVKVDPATEKISDDPGQNTEVHVWVEVFPASMNRPLAGGLRLHDYRCDTGGKTYEEAVVNVAREIYERHGNDRAFLTREWTGA